MKRLLKAIPMVIACAMGAVFFFMLGAGTAHMTKRDFDRLRAKNPKALFTRSDGGALIQFEAYGKPTEHKYRVQAQLPGTATFYDGDGKEILKRFLESGDVVVTFPKERSVDVIKFEPFEWVD